MKQENKIRLRRWMFTAPLLAAMLAGCGGGGGGSDTATASSVSNPGNAAVVTGNSGTTGGGTSTGNDSDSDGNASTGGGTTPPAANISTSQEWYVRLIAEVPSEGLKDKGNVLGRMNGSSLRYDSHDLPELDPAMAKSSYLTIVFPHEGWQKGDNYTSDYHGLDTVPQDSWDFVVRTDDANREVTLSWDAATLLELQTDENNVARYVQKRDASGDYADAMYLVDVDRNVSVKVMKEGIPQTYTFTMDGRNERAFRWVIDFSGTYTPPAEAMQTNTASMSARSTTTTLQTNKRPQNDTDELGTPPKP